MTASIAPRRVAVVGAGLAGLGAACVLAGHAPVTLVEKSRGPSGRAATRRRDGVTYDFGANFIDLAASDEVRALLGRIVPAGEFVPVEGAIWTHDEHGARAPGRPSEGERASLRDGLNRLGHRLLEASGAELLRQTRAHGVRRTGAAWWVDQEDGDALGPFEAVVLTPPAPQAADLLGPDEAALREALRSTPYLAQFCVVLALPHGLPAHDGVYAYLNTDKQHPIAWLSFESRKAGHVPAGQETLVVQMAPAWTEAHYETPPERVATEAARLAAALLEADIDVAWHDVQRWRYALPQQALDAGVARAAEARGLFVASDAVLGKGRAAGALQVGLTVGERVAAWLSRTRR